MFSLLQNHSAKEVYQDWSTLLSDNSPSKCTSVPARVKLWVFLKLREHTVCRGDCTTGHDF